MGIFRKCFGPPREAKSRGRGGGRVNRIDPRGKKGYQQVRVAPFSAPSPCVACQTNHPDVPLRPRHVRLVFAFFFIYLLPVEIIRIEGPPDPVPTRPAASQVSR